MHTDFESETQGLQSTELVRKARDQLLDNRTDYHAARAAFQWPDIEYFNWALDWFDAELANGSSANAVALKIVGEHAVERTFKDLSESSNRIANGLKALGVGRGDRLLLMLGNCVELWETMLAAMKIGAVTIPATTLLTAEDLRQRIESAAVRHVVTASEFTDRFELHGFALKHIVVGADQPGWTAFDSLRTGADRFAIDEPTRADDPILIYFTSGTTARPKLVVHSHRSYGIGSLTTMYWLGLLPEDLHLNVSSPGWAKHAWSCFFAPWNAGATVFIANQGRFNAKDLLGHLAENKVTSMCAPPTVWRMLIQEDLQAHAMSLRSVCGAGEPMNPEVIEEVERAWGLTIRDGFGQTETTAQIANTPGQLVVAGAVGRPLPGYDIVLIDADGAETSDGEIALRLSPRPAGLMRGYLQDDGSIVAPAGEFYRTGDIASRDASGLFTYVGRADDVFKASDYRISPFELESALIEHPAVIEVAVVPCPDPIRMAVPKAYIALAPSFTADEATARIIFAHIKAVLAPYKRVRRIEFGELPKTISGKIRRVDLRRVEIERARTGEIVDGEFREENFG